MYRYQGLYRYSLVFRIFRACLMSTERKSSNETLEAHARVSGCPNYRYNAMHESCGSIAGSVPPRPRPAPPATRPRPMKLSRPTPLVPPAEFNVLLDVFDLVKYFKQISQDKAIVAPTNAELGRYMHDLGILTSVPGLIGEINKPGCKVDITKAQAALLKKAVSTHRLLLTGPRAYYLFIYLFFILSRQGWMPGCRDPDAAPVVPIISIWPRIPVCKTYVLILNNVQVRKSVVERAAFRARAAGAAKTCHLLAGTTTISKGLAGRLVANGAPLGVPGKPFIAPSVNSTQRRRLQQSVAEPTSVNLANGYNVFIGKQPFRLFLSATALPAHFPLHAAAQVTK